MLDTVVLFFFFNIVIVSLIFWLLSFLCTKFFKAKDDKYSEEIFECGFTVDSQFNLHINLNVFFILNLLIIYDVEFMFLIPFFYNIYYITMYSVIIFFIFIFLVYSSLWVDWAFISLNWHY